MHDADATLTESEIAKATLDLARTGIYVEPTSAQAAAAFAKLLETGTITPDQTTVLVHYGKDNTHLQEPYWAEPHTAKPAAFFPVGVNPPWNQPQVTFLALSRFPMFVPVVTPSGKEFSLAAWLLLEQSS